ncbi:PAS domain-containing sensor histidine kinase [Pelodictyon luteolum]|uniref:histidine kinase n=1 Tax=Chlorobium luteolum (strain DSM 273 / BCRC 81028 / 2530) TaxID=319225 RepID=Q3B4C7_CHLL3|nr:sensor histidine kinase [Pelodictyon luteolum]ABB23804.1 PAS/PAC sensor signal transduction histidine kinase [Pelodictyon luteolum DSM 273]
MAKKTFIPDASAIDTIIDLVPHEAAVIDPHGCILHSNGLFQRGLGSGSPLSFGRNLFDIISSSPLRTINTEELSVLCRNVLETGLPSGNIRPLSSPDGAVQALVLTFPDDGAGGRTPADANQNISRALNAADAGTWQWNLKSGAIQWSEGLWRLFEMQNTGEPPSLAIWEERLDPTNRDSTLQAFAACSSSAMLMHVEYCIILDDGSRRWVMSRGRPYHDSRGAMEGYIGITIDITEQKKLEAELRDNKARFSFALGAACSGIWEWNIETDELLWSEEVWRLYGLSPGSETLNHQLCVSTVHEEDRAIVSHVIKDAVTGGRDASVEFRVKYPGDGSLHWLQSKGSPKRDADGTVVKYIGLITDITERKLAEIELIENRSRLEQALAAAKAGIWEWDLLTGRNTWSDEVWALYGLEPHSREPSFAVWAETLHPEDRDAACLSVQSASAEGREISFEYRVPRADGSMLWLLSRGQPRRDASGAIVKYLGTVIDVTEQKSLEEQLLKSKARMAFALEATKAGVWEWDLKHDQVFWSDRIWQLYGLESGSKPNNHKLCESNVLPEDREQTFGIVMQAANREIEIDIEFRVCHPEDGTIHWLACRGKPQLDAQGALDRYVGTIMDITDRKRLDDELRENERKFRGIFDNAPIAISIKEIDTGKIIDVNDAWLNLLGYTLVEVLGRTGPDIGIHACREDYQAIEMASLKRERICNRQVLLHEKNGDLVDVLYSTEFIEFEGMAVMLVMMVDVTLEKMQQQNISRLEQSIADRNIQLQKEVERLHRFLSMISHEYRTPLAIMRTNLDLVKMKNKMGNFQNRQEFAKIDRSIARLVEVLEVSIQESRMADRHKSVTGRHELPLAGIIKSQVEAFSGIWKERSVLFENCLEDVRVYGEESGVKFAIFNLLDNARKYSPDESPISITCRKAGPGHIMIDVGNELREPLEDVDMDLFFEKYHRGGNSSNTAGAGLGLWLVKNIVTQHEGHIALSKQASGIVVTITLPVIASLGGDRQAKP